MDNDEKSKMLYEKATELHKYFLDWRYKLLAGFFIIISTIGYFLITWVQNPANFTKLNYILICLSGLLVTIFFSMINHQLTSLIWRCQNIAYLHERDLGFYQDFKTELTKTGIYGEILYKEVRQEVDKGEVNPAMRKTGLINPFNHSGCLNWLFILNSPLKYAVKY